MSANRRRPTHFCHLCSRHVFIAPRDNGDIVCPCGSGFVEEVDIPAETPPPAAAALSGGTCFSFLFFFFFFFLFFLFPPSHDLCLPKPRSSTAARGNRTVTVNVPLFGNSGNLQVSFGSGAAAAGAPPGMMPPGMMPPGPPGMPPGLEELLGIFGHPAAPSQGAAPTQGAAPNTREPGEGGADQGGAGPGALGGMIGGLMAALMRSAATGGTANRNGAPSAAGPGQTAPGGVAFGDYFMGNIDQLMQAFADGSKLRDARLLSVLHFFFFFSISWNIRRCLFLFHF
jgi:hypothetical protein